MHKALLLVTSFSIALFGLLFLPALTTVYADNTHSVALDGSNDYLSATDSSSLSVTGDFTMEFWVNFDTFNSSLGTLASKYGVGTNQRAYYASYYQSGGNKYFETRISSDGTGPNTSVVTLQYDLATSTWYHLAFVYTAASGTIDLYLSTPSDSAHTHLGTMSGHKTTIKDSTSQFMLGSSSGDAPTVFFDGKMDDVRVWNDVRTVAELDANFKQELVGTESNLQGYWKLNNALTDSTTNGNTFSNNGGATFVSSMPFSGSALAADPSPVSGAIGVATSSDVSWAPGSGIVNQAMYFGTSSTPGTNEYRGTYSSTTSTYDPGTLTSTTTYYWRIDSWNGTATTTGTVWSFTTLHSSANNTHAISLNGANQYLYAGDSASLSITGDLTLGFWVNFSAMYTGGYKGTVVSKYGGGADQRGYLFAYRQDTNRMNYNFFRTILSDNGAQTSDTERAYPMATSTWYHLAYVYDASEGHVDIYLADADDSSHTYIGTECCHKTSIKDTTSYFAIATSQGDSGVAQFAGKIDDMRVWNDMRTVSELDANFRQELGVAESNLQAYWTFDETLDDETTNNNDLTNVNSAQYATSTPF